MRGSVERLGSEPWKISTWCSENSPGCSVTSTAWDSSTWTASSCPRDSRLSGWNLSSCATCFACVPGITRMLPDSGVLGDNATQAVTTSGDDRPQ